MELWTVAEFSNGDLASWSKIFTNKHKAMEAIAQDLNTLYEDDPAVPVFEYKDWSVNFIGDGRFDLEFEDINTSFQVTCATEIV